MTAEQHEAAFAIGDKFTQMSDRIKHNAESTFGGACVIVLPDQNRRSIEILVLDGQADVGQFLSTVQTRITILLQELQNQQNPLPFGRR